MKEWISFVKRWRLAAIFPTPTSISVSVPELLNDRFTAENVAAALRPLLEDTPERARMVADLAEARTKLGGADPMGRVCEVVEELLAT